MPSKILNKKPPIYLDEGVEIKTCTCCKAGNVTKITDSRELKKYGIFITKEYRCLNCYQLYFNTEIIKKKNGITK